MTWRWAVTTRATITIRPAANCRTLPFVLNWGTPAAPPPCGLITDPDALAANIYDLAVGGYDASDDNYQAGGELSHLALRPQLGHACGASALRPDYRPGRPGREH